MGGIISVPFYLNTTQVLYNLTSLTHSHTDGKGWLAGVQCLAQAHFESLRDSVRAGDHIINPPINTAPHLGQCHIMPIVLSCKKRDRLIFIIYVRATRETLYMIAHSVEWLSDNGEVNGPWLPNWSCQSVIEEDTEAPIAPEERVAA